MRKRSTVILLLFIVFWGTCFAEFCLAQSVELNRYENEHSFARLEPVKADGKVGLAVIFEGTNDLHYYAVKETAAGGFNLTIKASCQGMTFSQPVFPKWSTFYDTAQQKDVEVYVGNFTVFLPIESYDENQSQFDVEVQIAAIACTSKICLTPFTKKLAQKIDLSKAGLFREITLQQSNSKGETAKAGFQASYSAPFAFFLALVAGLILNIMPCVWPVIPIIVTRIWNLAGEKRSRSMLLGLAFCVGILLFFAAIAIANIVLRLGYGVVFQWGDPFRNPVFVTGLALFILALGLFMFGLINIGIPASVTSKAGGSKGGLIGGIGMGFLAALLATPCSFAILAAAFAWAQTQTLPIATFTIMLIGVGMAVPYILLTTLPNLLNRLPKPGEWMEHIKHALGFVLIFIAVSLIAALPRERMKGVLYYTVILSFCLWMWGNWVSFTTPIRKKLTVRLIALVIAIVTGWWLLPQRQAVIDWQKYDAEKIDEAKTLNKPVLIKFTADWCTSCKWLDMTVYGRKDIAQLIANKGIIAVKADTTLLKSKATIDLANLYKEPGVPVTVLHLSGGQERRLRGLFGKDELAQILNDLSDVKR